MFGFSHLVHFVWLSDAAQAALEIAWWLFRVIGFVAALGAVWYGLGLVL